jgi:hypothetical protein
MTQIRKGSFIRTVREISVGGALALAVLSGIGLSSCGSSEDEDAYSYEESTYSKGIRSHIREVRPGEFKIDKEENVAADSSVAIVTYLDGHTDRLSPAAAKALIDDEIRQNGAQNYHHSGLSNMLLYGGIGYMLGRNMNNGYINNYRANNPDVRGYYNSPSAYENSRNTVRTVDASRSTRTVTARPSSGRKGFFGSARGRSGG